MQLIANPPTNLSAVAAEHAVRQLGGRRPCAGTTATTRPRCRCKQQGRQTVGYRFVLGLVSLSAAQPLQPAHRRAADHLRASAPAQHVHDHRGSHVRRPGHRRPAGGGEAADGRRRRPGPGRWTTPSSAPPTGASAYPGAMPVYAVVPTQGLDDETRRPGWPSSSATPSGDGQVSGLANGQLPPGYLPVTAANGLGAEHDYVLTAAAAVRKQAGDVPALDIDAARGRGRSATSANAEADADADADADAGRAPRRPRRRRQPPPRRCRPRVGADRPSDAAGAPSGSATPPVTEAPTVLTAGQSSTFGRLGVPGLLVVRPRLRAGRVPDALVRPDLGRPSPPRARRRARRPRRGRRRR